MVDMPIEVAKFGHTLRAQATAEQINQIALLRHDREPVVILKGIPGSRWDHQAGRRLCEAFFELAALRARL
jgi:hypothetical protein